MKQLLLIAFYFPPRNHVAAVRAGCFAKYLPDFGWQPTVVCSDFPAHCDVDPALVGKLPDGIQIHSLPNRRPQGIFEKILVHKLATYIRPGRAPVFWWRQALERAESLLQRNQFDAIWATSDPLVTLGLASALGTRFRIPWIADLRDPFNVIPFGKWYRRAQSRQVERVLCRRADRVVTVTEGCAGVLHRRLRRPVTVIPNGYDPAQLPETADADTDQFVILHGGSVHHPRQRPELLLRGVELCLGRGVIPRNRLRVRFVGADRNMLLRACGDLLDRLPVYVEPKMPRYFLLNLQRRAAVLAVFSVARETGVLPAKIFELLAARRPILAVPDDRGEVSNLLQRTGAGVSLGDSQEIAAYLEGSFKKWEEGRLHPESWNRAEISQFSRSSQTARLAGLLDNIKQHGTTRMEVEQDSQTETKSLT